LLKEGMGFRVGMALAFLFFGSNDLILVKSKLPATPTGPIFNSL